MRNYLGLDIGTGACKAVVFNANGRQVSSAGREYKLHFTPDGGAELDPDEVIDQCVEVIGRAKGDAGGGVRAMGISSQGEAFTAVDGRGRALCRAMVSSDVRAASIASEWPASFGAERLYQITGHTAHPMFTLFKLLWLRENRPTVWECADRFLCFEDLLHLRLGLEPAIGRPLAGRTMLFDVRRHEWSPEILEAAGLPQKKLARPLPSGAEVGRTADGMLVVAGGHDQPCGALGAGATQAGVAMYATGSVECITPAFDRPVFSDTLRKANLCTYDHAAPGRYATVAFSLTGGNLLKWFRDQFAAGLHYDDLLATAAPDPTNLLALPYWTPSGTPHFDLRTPGAILGLRLSTTRGEILRALLEGVAFEMRLNLDILDGCGCGIEELRAIGGGAKSPWWTQLKADVIGKPITTLHVTEAGCLGAALLACSADTGEPVASLAARWVQPVARVEPQPGPAAHYRAQFARYQRLYPALERLEAADPAAP